MAMRFQTQFDFINRCDRGATNRRGSEEGQRVRFGQRPFSMAETSAVDFVRNLEP
jgi:hypothetical protein